MLGVGVGKPLLAHCIGWLPPYPSVILLEILIAPWGSWVYSYRIRLSAPVSFMSSTEFGTPRKNQEKSPVQSMSTQEWVCKSWFGREERGALKFRAVPNQASTPHVQNGALRLHSGTNSTLHDPFCTGFFSANVFLGPWIYNLFFFKNNALFLRLCSWFYFSLPAWPRWKDFFMFSFPCFLSFSVFDINMFVPCKSSVCFGCSSGWWNCAWVVSKLSWSLGLKVVVASCFVSALEFTTKGREVENLGTLGPL